MPELKLYGCTQAEVGLNPLVQNPPGPWKVTLRFAESHDSLKKEDEMINLERKERTVASFGGGLTFVSLRYKIKPRVVSLTKELLQLHEERKRTPVLRIKRSNRFFSK